MLPQQIGRGGMATVYCAIADREFSKVLIDASQGFSQAIHQGKTSNRIQVDCINSTLTLIVNIAKVAQIEGNDFSRGDIGLIAASFIVQGTNILFIDFIARQPE